MRRKKHRTIRLTRSAGVYSVPRKRRRKARRRSGFQLAAPMGRRTRRAGHSAGINSVTSAAFATLALWLGQSGIEYLFANVLKMPLPKSRALIPGVIALLAYKGKINIPGLLPIAVAQTLNTVRATSPSIDSMFDWTKAGYGALSNYNARPMTYAETVANINRLQSPNPMANYNGLSLAASAPNYNGLSLAPSAPNYSGYSQP